MLRRLVGSLTGRTVLLSAIVALVAVLVAALVAFPLIRGGAQADAQDNLDQLADITVATLQQPESRAAVDRLRERLDAESVTPYVIGPGLQWAPGLSESLQQDIIAGSSVSATVAVDGSNYFAAGRPIDGSFGLVLLAPTGIAEGMAGGDVRRLAVALLAGLAVAVLLGLLAARRVTRPLRSAADAAEQLSAGRRDVRVDPTGPTEVADIATSLNHLSAALTTSEGRQRDFLLSVSHELRTPLTAIQGYAEALSDDLIGTEQVPATGAVLLGEAQRLDRLVADLLDLARLGAADVTVNPVDLDLVELAAGAAAVWSDRCARDGVLFRTEFPDTPLPVRSDPVRVRQILDNLAENALRVTPAGQPIVLSVGADGAQAVLSVRDGGPGLTADDRAVAFEPGALHARYGGERPVGSGVGLALVGRLAVRLGGSASVGEAPEGGAWFAVRLPRLLPATGADEWSR